MCIRYRADGSRDSDEDAVIRLAAKLLGVTDVESAVARKSAQGKSWTKVIFIKPDDKSTGIHVKNSKR